MFPLFRQFVLGAVLALLVVPASRADKLVLVAGGGKDNDGIPATQAKLKTPFGVAFDKGGNLYLVELGGQPHSKARSTPRSVLTTSPAPARRATPVTAGLPARRPSTACHNLAVRAQRRHLRGGYVEIASAKSTRKPATSAP